MDETSQSDAPFGGISMPLVRTVDETELKIRKAAEKLEVWGCGEVY
jgi:hypothetical protein